MPRLPLCLQSRHALIAVPLILLAFWLRLDRLGDFPVRWDEAFSVYVANMDLRTGANFTAGDVHPPIYYWLLHGWLRLAGSSEFSIRALSVLSSAVMISTLYALTLRLSKQGLAAALAAALATISPYHIHWSQDARMYGLTTMFASLSIYAYLRGRARQFSLFALGAALSHYFGAIVFGMLALHELLTSLSRRASALSPWRRRRHHWFAALGIILAVCSIWAAYAYGMIRKDPSFANFDPQAAFVLMASVFAVNASTHLEVHAGQTALIAAVFFAGLGLSYRANPRATALILLGCLAPPAAISILGLPFIPVHVNALQDRYFMIFSPFVYAGFGISLAAILAARRLRLVGALIVIGIVALYAALLFARAEERYFKDDYRSLMGAVAALTTKRDRVFIISGGRKPIVYYHLDRVGYQAPSNTLGEPKNVVGIPHAATDVDALMQRIFAGLDRFWLIEVEAHLDQPPNARIDWVNQHYHRIHHIPVDWNGLSLYSRDPQDTVPNVSVLVAPVVREARPGDHVRIGVPAGARVDLVHSGQVIDTKLAEVWTLHEFDIYAFYFNGSYALRLDDQHFPFEITHSQDFPGSA